MNAIARLHLKSGLAVPVLILGLAPVLIGATLLLSILYGAKNIDTGTVLDAFFRFDAENVNHQIILTSRLPRGVGALLIGAALAVAGALMQGMTRNYLASPSIMGVSDGSAFIITICIIFLPNSSSLEKIFYSFVGSALGVGIVLGLATLSPNGLSPVRLAIIGTIVGTFLSSISVALSTYFRKSQDISFWYNARLNQLDPDLLKLTVPFAVGGLILALLLAKSITILSLGEEVSISLGQRTTLVKLLTMLNVVILTGISVALAGKIGFVGLIIPHVTRFFVGIDYKWVIPCSAVLGGVFLGLSDVLSRFLNYPFDIPIGVVTALIGVPFFLYLIRTRGGAKHV